MPRKKKSKELSPSDGVFLDDLDDIEEEEVEKPKPKKARKARPFEEKLYRRAYSIEDLPEVDTVECLVTKSKYIGTQWWNLKKGSTITAPKAIIMVLKDAGFVK